MLVCLSGAAFYIGHDRPVLTHRPDPAVEELTAAVKAYKLVRQDGYNEISPDQACRGMIEGLLAQVDEYCAYIPPEKYDSFCRRLEGRLQETGLRVQREGDRLLCLGALPDSPASHAGIRGGEEIVTINNRPVSRLDGAEIERLLASGPGGSVSLHIRDDSGLFRLLELPSAAFDLPTVTGLLLDDRRTWDCDLGEGIYYIRIREFDSHTPEQLHELYSRLDHPYAVVLDLRDNPGGTLSAAADVADRFLRSGLIVRTVGRDGSTRAQYAREDMTYPDLPMVVLINGRTASAAEIVAGSLRAHGRAALVGQTSYGKWLVQSILPIGRDAGYLYLTTAEYFLPEMPPTTHPAATAPASAAATASAAAPATMPSTAPTTQASRRRGGLSPDVPVELTAEQEESLRELQLQAILVPPPLPPEVVTAPGSPGRGELKEALLAADLPLAEAVAMLREELPATRPAATGPVPTSRP